MGNEQLRFIDKLYKDLYLDETVIRYGSGNKYDKFSNIKAYIEKVEELYNKMNDTGRHIEWLRKLYYDKYVIKAEDIPESYYASQQKIALERGYGYIEIDEVTRKQYQEQIISDQKSSFDVWFDYFFSEDAKVYPFWAKYWAFQGMLKMGIFDKKNLSFSKRTKATVAPFPDLNREALAMSIDVVVKTLNNEEINDERLEALVESGSFPKIYSYVLTNVLSDNKQITKRNDGIWVKYLRGSDHMPLVKSLQGYNTGWCTAGEATAKGQLAGGDFYVYYTLDEALEYKVPRIAIRMENDHIGEIRGVSSHQNIEPEMEPVVEEKLKEFPDRDNYYKRVNDMKKLTLIYTKHKNNVELTIDELKFLYEIDYEVSGFGYDTDPRIAEIKKERNQTADVTRIFDGVEQITGYLDLSGLTSIDGLVFPKKVDGSLILYGLKSAKNLVLPEFVGGDLELAFLNNFENLTLPKCVLGNLSMISLESANNLRFPEVVGGSLNLNRLNSTDGLKLPREIKKDLHLNGLKNAHGLVLPDIIDGVLELNGLKNAYGLNLPEVMNGSLKLDGLKTTDGLKLPKVINGYLSLDKLTSTDGLELPEVVGKALSLDGLKSADGLKLPKKLGGSLSLNGLKNANGLELPEHIDGCLFLADLEDANGLVLPQTVTKTVYLDSLTSIDGLVIPTPLTYKIYIDGFDITPENVHEYIKTSKNK